MPFVILFVIFLVLAAIPAGCYFQPQYNVWQQGLAGQAELARAEQNRQIKIEEAKAALESADLLNQAEIKRAEGLAEANRIIGDSLRGNEAYLRYLWVQNLEEGAGATVIYVPTEAGMPLLEAGKRPVADNE